MIWLSRHISHSYLRINSAAYAHFRAICALSTVNNGNIIITYCLMDAGTLVNMYVERIARSLPGVARGQFLQKVCTSHKKWLIISNSLCTMRTCVTIASFKDVWDFDAAFAHHQRSYDIGEPKLLNLEDSII